MSKLFIYYSLTGNGDFVADFLEKKGYDLRKVTEKAKAPKSFFLRVFIGGFRAGLNLKGKLVDYNNNIDDYDEVVVGTPVWNGKFPPAINSVLAQTNFKDKKLSFIFYSGSGDVPAVNDKLLAMYPNVNVRYLKEPKFHEQELDKLDNI